MSSVIVVKRGYRRAVIAAGMRGAPGAGGGGSAGVSSFNTRTGPVTLVSADVSGALGYTPANSADLAGVALSGAYADLSGLPAIPAAPGDLGAATAAQGAKADTAVQPGELASVAVSGSYADLSAKPFIPALPGDIGAATAAQGAKADTAVQPAALTSGLAGKVDVDGAKVLSDENYTSAEKAKLAGLEGAHFKGLHASLAALQAAHPSAVAGDYADVDSGAGADVARYIWDVSDSAWIIQSGASGSMTAAQIKTAYESNPDTNGFSDAEQAKLAAIAAGATANATDAQLRDRALHTGQQAASTISDLADAVRGVIMTGVTFATATAGLATDSLLVFIGKLQAQINGLATDVAGKQATLVSATNIKTVNGASLLGAGDLAISGGGVSLPVVQTFTGAKTLGLADINTYNVSQDATAQPVTLPAQATVAWTDHAELHIEQGAAGAVTITGAAGVTINGVVAPSIVLFAKGAAATLKRKGSNNWTLVGAIGTAAEQRAALNCANKSGDTYTGQHDYGNTGALRFTGASSVGSLTAAASSGGLKLSVVGSEPTPLFIDFDASVPDAASSLSVRFFRGLNTSGACSFVFHKGNGTGDTQHSFDGKGAVRLNRLDGETVIGSGTSNNVDRLQVAGSIIATGAIKLASFTLATLPSAAANARGQVYVSNLAGQAAPVYSDGTSWRRVSDNTVAN